MLKLISFIAILAGVACAQAPTPQKEFKAPPEVEAKLKARVQLFFQLHQDGNFKKAWDMIADDTKDYWLGAYKPPLAGFEIVGIHFRNEEYTMASVDVILD